MDCKRRRTARDAARTCCSPIGRVPNTDDLGLDAAGIATDERGYIEVDESCAPPIPNVWALGDCNGKGAFTHTAYNDYEIVADNLLSNAGRKWTDRIPAYALYTDPPLGRVGMSEAEIRKAGLRARCRQAADDARRARDREGRDAGFLKIHVEAGSERILGAALLGTGGDEAVQSLVDACTRARRSPSSSAACASIRPWPSSCRRRSSR